MSSFYKKYMIPIATTILFLSLIGCDGEGGSDSSNSTTSRNNSLTKATTLADANVAIYKIKDDGSLSLLWEEKTSSGDTLEQIGEFNLHTNELTDDDFYLYKVTSGKDWDSDNNGVLDKDYTLNKGVFRSIAQGVDIKKASDDFKVSYTTELFYEEVVPTLKRKFDRATFPSILNNKVSKIIESSNNIKDILTFDSTKDKAKLKEFYKIRVKSIVDDIHQGKIPALNMSAILGSFDMEVSIFGGFALSSDGTKAYVLDNRNGLVVIDISDPINLIQLELIHLYDLNVDNSSLTMEYDLINDFTLSSDGTKAYVASIFTGLVVVDISNPTNPTKLGSIDTSDTKAVILSSDGTKAYMVGIDGLVVVDISDPINPTKLGSIDTSDANTVILSTDGTKAYVAGIFSGLVIVDISDPTNPTKLGSYNEGAYDITLSSDGTKAYVVEDNGLVVIDISNPTNPTKLGSHDIDDYSNAVMLSSDGTKAYVANEKSGLLVIDISDPTNLTQLGSYGTGGNPYDVRFSSDGTKAYVKDVNGLVAVDISNPINTPKLGSYGTVENTQGVPSSEGTNTNIARVLNTIQNVSTIFSSYGIADNSTITDVTLSSDGTKVYVGDEENGLLVIDISDPTNPIKLGSLAGNTYGITLSNDGTKAYVIDKYNGLLVINISDPTTPTKLGSYYNTLDTFWDITLSNDDTKAYITDYGNDSLVVIDVSDPANPTKLGSYHIAGGVTDIALSSDGTKAYMANSENVLVVNISDPTNPTKLGIYGIGDWLYDVTLSTDDKKAYVTNFHNGLVVIDISDPTNPTKLGSLNTVGLAHNITLSSDGEKAYVADGYNSLVVIDVSNPTNPIKLGSYSTEGYAVDVTLSNDDNKAYVADKGNGLVVIDLDLYN